MVMKDIELIKVLKGIKSELEFIAIMLVLIFMCTCEVCNRIQ